MIYSRNERIARLTSGCVGEMGVLEGVPRSATVLADAEGATVLILGAERFRSVLISPCGQEILLHILHELVERLRKSNTRLQVRSGVQLAKSDPLTATKRCKWRKLRNGVIEGVWAHSKKLSIFASVSDSKLLEIGTIFKITEESVLFCRGDLPDSCYLILEGNLEVVADGLMIARLERGDVAGFMGLLGADGRSATVQVPDHCVVLKVGAKDVSDVVASNSEFLLGAIRYISRRIETSNQMRKFQSKVALDQSVTTESRNERGMMLRSMLQSLNLPRTKSKGSFSMVNSSGDISLYGTYSWREGESEYRIEDIGIDQVVRSLVTSESVIPNVVSVNGVVLYDSFSGTENESFSGDQVKFLSLLASAINLAGLKSNCNFEEMLESAQNLVVAVRGTEEGMKSFEASEGSDWVQVLKLCSFNCWGHADFTIRNQLPDLFKEPFYARKMQGMEYHIQIHRGENIAAVYGVTLVAKYMSSRAGNPIAIITFGWTVVRGKDASFSGRLSILGVDYDEKVDEDDQNYIEKTLRHDSI